MKPDVLVMAAQSPAAMAHLEAGYTLHHYYSAEDPAALLAEVGPQCRAIATMGSVRIGKEQLEFLPNLELVACGSAG